MNLQTRREIRSGLISLALSGLLIALAIPLRGPVDLTDPESLIKVAASPNYVPAWAIILVGGVLHLYGIFGLYRYLTYRAENVIAFLALALRLGGFALSVQLLTFLALDLPVIAHLYQQGNQEVIVIVEAHFTGLGLALFGVAGAAALIGWLLFTIAMWRDGRLPRWTVVLFVLSSPLASFAAVPVAELLGAVLLLSSAGIIAWKGWQETAVDGVVVRRLA